ncbi:hypothetical protein CEP51_002538 [Fusarium floridanum]|uniref:Transferase n=1 Tax=Fusarium floridanum TaxID=1325733 RepID=A0A428SAZ2_9HYPO|nr:hypothetical protein CEP51_002538 [Fusarium floridanum]
MAVDISVIESVRLNSTSQEKVIALSLIDCTTANFSYGSAIWLYQPPKLPESDKFNLGYHLRESLALTLQAYPQWSGHLKVVSKTDGVGPPEAQHFPPHARRFGRIYAHFGTATDPGVEFVYAKSSATLDSLYLSDRPLKQPLWSCETATFHSFLAATTLAHALQPKVDDESGRLNPLMAVQVTELACGGFVVAVKGTHPLADATSFISLLKDWAAVSRSVLERSPIPTLTPLFDPALLDNQAAGDINAEEPDDGILQKAKSLPLHRYDWWASAATCPWTFKIPSPFDTEEQTPAGKVMPWDEWDLASPVSNYVVHLNREQVDFLWNKANKNASEKLSRHDAVLGHIWSCVARARSLQDDDGPIHCDLVYGVRPSFQLGSEFQGSPCMMMNVELPGSKVADESNLTTIATKVRQTLKVITDKDNMAAHLYSIAYEKSPQRIWQAFLGRRHILVTTWGRAGIYDIDFGLGSECSYAEGVVPEMDGNILIKEAPGKPGAYWTDNGVDISIHIRTEDMERLIEDPLLLPEASQANSQV